MKPSNSVPAPGPAGGPSAFHKSLQAANLERLRQHDAHLARIAKGNVTLPTPSRPARKPKLVVPGMPNQSASSPTC